MRKLTPKVSQHLEMPKTNIITNAKIRHQNGTLVGVTAGKWEGPFKIDNTKPSALDTESN